MNDLINPDEFAVENIKFSWEPRYQLEILSLLYNDRIFLIQSIDLVKPNHFIDECHEALCSILLTYFNKYKTIPAPFVVRDEVKIHFNNNKEKILRCLTELDSINEFCVTESKEHCLDRLVAFAKENSIRQALSQTITLLQQNSDNKFSKIESLFKNALLVDRKFDVGLDYFQSIELRYQRMIENEANNEVFLTGFYSIDNALRKGGLRRGEIGCYMANSGAGKSLALARSAVVNVMRSKKVIYVTLEMGQDQVAERIDAQIANIGISKLLAEKDNVISSINDSIREEDDKSRFFIKQFPAGTADINTVRALLVQYRMQGFIPDILILDYIGELKDYKDMKIHESRQLLVRDLRCLAVEENLCVLTAAQANRKGKEAQDVSIMDDDSLGDSYGQVRPLDALWSINQNHQEQQLNVGRIFVSKHRDGKSKFILYFKRDPDNLLMEEISKEEYTDIRSKYVVDSNDMKKKIKGVLKSRPHRTNMQEFSEDEPI